MVLDELMKRGVLDSLIKSRQKGVIPFMFLEEMAVDPTLNIAFIQQVAPYPQKAYDRFYKRMIDGISAEDHIINIYKSRSSIEDF